MEFKFRDGENRRSRTPSPPPMRSLSTLSYLSHHHPLRGGDFPGIIPPPRVFPTAVPFNAEEAFRREMERQQIRRELEKEEIRREILAGEMARRRELEEEVMRELASERALRMPMPRFDCFSFSERVSLSMNPRMRLNSPVNNINISGGPQPQLAPEVDITQLYKQTQTPDQTQTQTQTQTNKDKVIVLAKPNAALCGAKLKEVLDVDLCGVKRKEVLDVDLGAKRKEVLDVDLGAKRKMVTPFPVDDEHSGPSLQKKPKKQWTCELCQIVATSEKGLNDHLHGKKHKVKATSLTTQKMGKSTTTTSSLKKSKQCVKSNKVVTMSSGLVAVQDNETLKSGLNPADKGTRELREKELAVQKMGKSTKTTLSLGESNQCVKSNKVVTMSSGLDAVQDSETLKSGLNPADKGTPELREKELAVQKMGKSTKTTLSLGKSNQCVKSNKVVTMSSGSGAVQDSETLKSGLNPADKGTPELSEKELAVQKSQDLGGIENETTIEKEDRESNALTPRKKFKFYCAFCQVKTSSEVVMQSHKNGKKHLANMKKLCPDNGAAAKSG